MRLLHCWRIDKVLLGGLLVPKVHLGRRRRVCVERLRRLLEC